MRMSNYFSLALAAVLLWTDGANAASNQGFQKVKTDGPHVYYEGSAVVSGAYHEKIRASDIGNFEEGLICFSVHGLTERLIPREQDPRSPWFCFANTEKARSALRIPASAPGGTCIIYGKATVQISKYVVDKTESEVHDMAFLDKVVSFEKPTFRKECSVVP